MSQLYRDQIMCGELSAREIRCEKPLALILGAALVLTADSPSVMSLDCNGAGRNVDMAAVTEQGMEGKMWWINNNTAATYAITLRDAAAATIVSIPATKSAIVCVIKGVWRVLGVVA